MSEVMTRTKYRVVVLEHGHHQQTEHEWVLGEFATLREAEARAQKFNRGNASDPHHAMFGETAVVEEEADAGEAARA
jgi:hypothetical protein